MSHSKVHDTKMAVMITLGVDLAAKLLPFCMYLSKSASFLLPEELNG